MAMIKAGLHAYRVKKPLYFDFWETSLSGEAYLGVVTDMPAPHPMFLACGEDEKTTDAIGIKRGEGVLVVETLNSIYVVAETIVKKKVLSTDDIDDDRA